MARKAPIQGFDVSISIVGPNGPELAGEFNELEISIKNETEEYLETNERIAQILDGEIKIDGKLKRGMVYTDVIRRVYGVSSMKRGTKIPSQPRFTITATFDAPEKGLTGKQKLLDVIIPELSISVKAGKTVVNKDLSFKAEGIEEA
ncbi:hypothetical protein [Paenibacillus naphthalenovorans]|uniref:hypothetical protein n=1 Tax=Paenibacillus naphthalenovorans TaxID=162209 RepID=UPI0008836A6E|nr:hypothetical protein [Paenibacillus naphthalenovorans]SDI49157.1 hypothetical protein SAMN05421868_10723 [Paenibacillus naphthalenovorans]